MIKDDRGNTPPEVIPASPARALAALTEPVQRWWHSCFGMPTTIQRLAWRRITAGDSCLLAAPTGSGKTLAAFLPILDHLCLAPKTAGVRCLYISPLKALCNDLAKNLRQVVSELASFFPQSQSMPSIGLRTGDTSAAARRKLLHQPPEILLTTPESLAVMLTQPAACRVLAGAAWVVVDEVHSLAATKRGADLSLSLERLQEWCGCPLQRIGMSATCTPLESAGRFLGGTGRPCTICSIKDRQTIQLAIEPLGRLTPDTEEHGQRFFRQLLDRLEAEIRPAETTLVFTNTRSLAERLTWALRRRFPDWADAIAVHHSSLSRQRRRLAEQQLKRGLLRVVVSSTSLELGIDIGSVENVVLVHPPGDVTRLLQRIGRAGHGPGRVRRGLILTGHAAELLEAVVTAAAGQAGQIESLRIPSHPLDVLCQQLLGIASTSARNPEQVYELVRRAYPYRDLSFDDFQACLNYLSGKREDGREWLPPRLRWTESQFTIADARTLKILRRNLGTILADDPLAVRLADQKKVGELDPSFAERLQPGDRFLLDGRCLEVKRTDPRGVMVEEVPGRPRVPRWPGNGWPLSPELARRVFVFRTQAAEALRDGPAAFARFMASEYGIAGPAVETLLHLLQMQETLSEIPEGAALLIEGVNTGHGTDYYFHTPLNRAGNDALARVLEHRLAAYGCRVAVPVVADLGFLFSLEAGKEITPDDWRGLFTAQGFHEHLAKSLEQSALLKERFRQAAYTGLMLLRNPLGKKQRVGGHDWAERRLFRQVQGGEGDFVLLRQARRDLHELCLDAEAACGYAEEMQRRSIRLRWLPCVSPFAEAWTQLVYTPAELIPDPTQALEKLHAALMGKSLSEKL